MRHILDFRPLPGLSSPHLQMFFATFGPKGSEPMSKSIFVTLDDGDKICCKVSTPPEWHPHQQTIALVHGLGGDENSSYMVRMTRKFYQLGFRVVRINLRGCGSGKGLNKRPYTSGDSGDIKKVLECLKKEDPHSLINLFGFSLGGNIVIKLAGELGEKASPLIHRLTAICPVIDVSWALASLIEHKPNKFYHQFYLKSIINQTQKWTKNKSISSIYEYDAQITVPLWGYLNIHDFYEKASSARVISNVQLPFDLIMSLDDPFIDHRVLDGLKLSNTTKVWLTHTGGHLGFIGRSEKEQGVHWLDNLLITWYKDSLNLETAVEDNRLTTASIGLY